MSKKQKIETPTDPAGKLDREHLARIRAAEAEIGGWEIRVGELQESLKHARSNLREAVRRLREEIADGAGRLPFGEQDKAVAP